MTHKILIKKEDLKHLCNNDEEFMDLLLNPEATHFLLQYHMQEIIQGVENDNSLLKKLKQSNNNKMNNLENEIIQFIIDHVNDFDVMSENWFVLKNDIGRIDIREKTICNRPMQVQYSSNGTNITLDITEESSVALYKAFKERMKKGKLEDIKIFIESYNK